MESVSESAATGRRATVTQIDEWMVHDQVFRIYDLFASIPRGAQTLMLELQRDKHVEYLTKGLQQLGPSFVVLDANRPWLCYWILHSLALLGQSVDHELGDNAVDFLNRCQDPNGGYGGGPGQLPHLATTYATVNSLITLGGEKALSSINRGKLSSFLQRMKQPSGAFRMHDAGEIDVRACYTAISVASVLNILDDELVMGVGNYILSCQTYEGGIAGEPGSEAHGGYTFCGLATMVLINEVNCLDLAGLINWVVFRQGVECGFQGRTNKLVDGCYSFWQGGVFALLQNLHVVSGGTLALSDGEGDSAKDSDSEGEVPGDNLCRDDQTCHCECGVTMTSYKIASYPLIPSVILLREIVFFVIILFLLICLDLSAVQSNAPGSVDCSGSYTQNLRRSETEPLFQSMALQQYILLCSQDQEGGFRDKPGKARDYYHTCYCLSGLSVCQYSWSKNENAPPLPNAVVGPYSNLLEPIHPVYNIVLQQYHEAHEFFSRS